MMQIAIGQPRFVKKFAIRKEVIMTVQDYIVSLAFVGTVLYTMHLILGV